MPTGAAPNPLTSLFPFLIIIVIFYVLIIRPQNKKLKEQKKMLAELKKGDEVVTSSGIHGAVANIRGNLVDVKVSEEVKITFSKEAISYVKKPQDLEQENKVEVIK